jgi:hypothetical protein
MLNGVSHVRLIGGWFAAVLTIMLCSVAAGAALTVSIGELWLAACLTPPAVMLLVWRDQPVTVAELLYSVNTTSPQRRP